MSETEDGLGSTATPQPGLSEAPDEASLAHSSWLVSGIAASSMSRSVAAVRPHLLIPITFAYLGVEIYGLSIAAATRPMGALPGLRPAPEIDSGRVTLRHLHLVPRRPCLPRLRLAHRSREVSPDAVNQSNKHTWER